MRAAELVPLDRDWLTVNQVASVLGCNPDTVRELAKKGALPFSTLWVGNTVKFPKQSFLAWMGVNT